MSCYLGQFALSLSDSNLSANNRAAATRDSVEKKQNHQFPGRKGIFQSGFQAELSQNDQVRYQNRLGQRLPVSLSPKWPPGTHGRCVSAQVIVLTGAV